jgi:glutathione S-transferase
MAQYKLHCVGASGNAYKVALYLNCAGLDWEPVGVAGAERCVKCRRDIPGWRQIR